jgi:hypothetical protein
MEIIDRYVAEVGRHLPEKSRPDLMREIRSLLEDALEDRSRATGRAPDEDMAVELLKEYGAPSKVAAAYLPPRYLIGPQLFPIFFALLKIVLVIVMVAVLIEFGVSLGRDALSLGDVGVAFLNLVANLLSGALQAFGTLALVFALIQWATPEFKVPDVTWDPRKLRPVDVHEKPVKVFDLALEIFFTVVALLVLGFYGRKIGMYFAHGGEWYFVPVLTEVFYRFVPVISIFWGLVVARDLWVLRENRWTAAARWFSAGMILFNAGILLAMLLGQPIVALTADSLRGLAWLGWPAETFQAVQRSLEISVRVVLIFALLGAGVELVKTFYALLFQREGQA